MYCVMPKYTGGYIFPKNCTQNYTGGIISRVGIFSTVTQEPFGGGGGFRRWITMLVIF